MMKKRKKGDLQQTVKDDIEIKGYGIHTGKPSRVVIRPAPEDTGIVFKKEGVTFPATVDYVVDVTNATTVGYQGVSIRTVEHLLSALHGLGIDNAFIEVEGEEIPGLDGSAKEFAERILEKGIKVQNRPRRYFRITGKLRVENEKGGFVEICPDSGGFSAECAIEYNHPFLRSQKVRFRRGENSFVEEVAPARTYCFYEEIAHLLKRGLGRGGNIRNAVVIGKDGVLNGPARFEDEPVRHKLLDLLGDLALWGMPLKAEVRAHKAGHALHVKFLQALKDACGGEEVGVVEQ